MIDLSLVLIHLQSDPIMAKLIARYDPPTWRDKAEIDVFSDLISAIISQQLSVKVADVIEARFLSLMGNQKPTPFLISEIEDEDIRKCGVSYAKIRYLKAAAAAAMSGQVDFESLVAKTDEEVIDGLSSIHGVGRWTAEMLLISSLHRPDVFSMGDLGLRTAVARLYHVERTDLASIRDISQQWSPYRSIASKYLWKSLDNQPIVKP